MTNKELLYVKTVADEKSISKAAKKLYIAQPSLSQSIQRLEDTLGTSLFNRTANGLTLTYAGERYYQIATQILRIYEDFEIEISDMNNLKTGRLHIGITIHLGAIVLSKILPDFQRRYPLIEVYITEETSTELERKILSGELDFAIMHAPKENQQPQISYDVLVKDPFLLILSKEHPLCTQGISSKGYPHPVMDLKLLKQEPFIMLHKEQRIRQIVDSVLKQAGISQPKISLTLRNFETAQRLASQGMGATMLPSQYFRSFSDTCTPALFSIEEKYAPQWAMCIATSKGSFLSKASRTFIDSVKENF